MVCAELDELGSHKIDVLLIPKVHLNDPPLPDQNIRYFWSGVARHRLSASDPIRSSHDAESWIESPKVIWIGCDRLLTGSASADHHVSIHNVGCPARRQ